MSHSMKGAGRIEIELLSEEGSPESSCWIYTRKQWGARVTWETWWREGPFFLIAFALPACALFVTSVDGFSVSSESIATVNTVIFLRNFTRFCVRWSAPVQETKAVVSRCLPSGVNQSSCVQIHILLEEMSWLCPLLVLTCWCLKNFILEIQEQGGGYRRVVFVFVYSSWHCSKSYFSSQKNI